MRSSQGNPCLERSENIASTSWSAFVDGFTVHHLSNSPGSNEPILVRMSQSYSFNRPFTGALSVARCRVSMETPRFTVIFASPAEFHCDNCTLITCGQGVERIQVFAV